MCVLCGFAFADSEWEPALRAGGDRGAGGGGGVRLSAQQVRVRLFQMILILVLSFFCSVDSVLVRFACLECEFRACFLCRGGFQKPEG